MSMESSLVTLLTTVCPRVFPDVAKSVTAVPYVTWQDIGGEVIRFLDKDHGGKRITLVQVSVWSVSRTESLAMIRQIEDALMASAAFQCKPEGESISMCETESEPWKYGCIQRFSILADR